MSLLPTCHEVQTDLTEYAEGALPFRRKVGIWIHLALCKVCAGFLRGLKALPGLAKASLAPLAEPPEDANQALAAVRVALVKRPKI